MEVLGEVCAIFVVSREGRHRLVDAVIATGQHMDAVEGPVQIQQLLLRLSVDFGLRELRLQGFVRQRGLCADAVADLDLETGYGRLEGLCLLG